MDPYDFLPIIQQSINVKAVALAVVFTMAVKYWLLPSPVPGEKSIEVIPGHFTTRLLPFLPVVFGMLFCGLIERDSTYAMENVIKGIFSGVVAAYTYRTTKVSIFGA